MGRMQREKSREEKMKDTFLIESLFETDPDLKAMRQAFPKRFFQLFTKGYLNYEAGEWDVARVVFEQTRHMLADVDGPSQALLRFIARFNYDSSQAPLKGWPGHRELNEI